jgi:hypothetical protein
MKICISVGLSPLVTYATKSKSTLLTKTWLLGARTLANLPTQSAGGNATKCSKTFPTATLFYLIQQLNERAFLFLRDAKLRQLVNLNRRRDKKEEEEATGFLGLTSEVKDRWICVTILADSALEFCRLLHPILAAFEGKERVKALCLCGVALARLCRFYEAHRRLNEANALLSKINVSASDRDVLLGILELRRAEAHLLEGMLLKELRDEGPSNGTSKTPHVPKKEGMTTHLYDRYLPGYPENRGDHDTRLRRLRIAKLDDGWCALERAERLLSGRLRSSHWWSRLCVLKLRCLAEQSMEKESEFRSLARRIQSQPLNQVYDLLHNGLAGCQEETRITSRLRLVDLALRIAYNLNLSNSSRKMVFDTLEGIAEPILKDGSEQKCRQIQKYAENIREFLFHGRPSSKSRRQSIWPNAAMTSGKTEKSLKQN